jgi:hypothetical protein
MHSKEDWTTPFIMQGYISPEFWAAYQAEFMLEDCHPREEDCSQSPGNSSRPFSFSALIACLLLMLSGLTLATHSQPITSAVSVKAQQLVNAVAMPTR